MKDKEITITRDKFATVCADILDSLKKNTDLPDGLDMILTFTFAVLGSILFDGVKLEDKKYS